MSMRKIATIIILIFVVSLVPAQAQDNSCYYEMYDAVGVNTPFYIAKFFNGEIAPNIDFMQDTLEYEVAQAVYNEEGEDAANLVSSIITDGDFSFFFGIYYGLVDMTIVEEGEYIVTIREMPGDWWIISVGDEAPVVCQQQD